MSSFEETLSRMKNLYTYGQEINESNNAKNHTLEYHAEAANGKSYGIIRECNKYYIKSAPAEKATIAEAYDYIGGFNNKKDFEYSSFAVAQKQFELKLASINESCDGKVNVATLDPFRANAVLAEGTDKMRDEIARCRQIMYNASMLMNEATEIGADKKGDAVMYNRENPEAEHGKKGCEGCCDVKAEPEFDGKDTKGVDKKVGPFDENAPKCVDQLKEEAEDWGSEGMDKGRDPKQIGWEMEGQQVVNEEEEDWGSEGLPSTPGVGEADTDHNNGIFNKAVNEGEACPACGSAPCTCGEDDEADDEELKDAESNQEAHDAAVADMKAEYGDKYIDANEEEDVDVDLEDGDEDFDVDDFSEEDFNDDEEDIDDVEDDEFADDEEDADFVDDVEGEDVEDNDILAQIEELQAQIDALKAQIGGEEELPSDDEELPVDDDEIDIEDDDVDIDGTEDFEDEDFDDADFEGEGDVDECGEMPMFEAKEAKMNAIVESVVKKILAEDELHDFGKHPGYRKKPMDLPTTGEDKNQWGEDWNDESAHNEQPFGQQIGDGDPFNKLVDAITKDVVSQLKEVKKK